MNDFKNNWAFSETHMPEIKDILKRNAMHIVNIVVAEPEDDIKHSTDLKIKITSGDVAVRIRRANKDFRDLTIRAKNGNSKTEIHKIREGFADWYLYLWTNDLNRVCDWILVNVGIMRSCDMFSDKRKIIMNKDGYTGFVAYSINELDKCGALVARR